MEDGRERLANSRRRTGSTTSLGSLSLSRLRGEDGGREDGEGDVFGEGRREGEDLGGITIEDNRQRTRWFSFESLDDIQQFTRETREVQQYIFYISSPLSSFLIFKFSLVLRFCSKGCNMSVLISSS